MDRHPSKDEGRVVTEETGQLAPCFLSRRLVAIEGSYDRVLTTVEVH